MFVGVVILITMIYLIVICWEVRLSSRPQRVSKVIAGSIPLSLNPYLLMLLLTDFYTKKKN